MTNRSQTARWRTPVPATVLAVALLVTPGCSRISHHFFHHSVTRTGTLAVSPPTGAPGSAFSFTAGGFKAGEAMNFEVDLPNHTRFVGPSHTAGPDGRVTSTYTALAGDPPGVYVVKATGALGTRAQASLVVTGNPPTSANG